jgi:hypothetical protein
MRVQVQGGVCCDGKWVGARARRCAAAAREYAPSVLVTTGRLLLESLGEDILEVWGEVRAV